MAQAAATTGEVNPFAAAQGDYRHMPMSVTAGELGMSRYGQVRVLRNVGQTHVDRWMLQEGSGFEEPQRKVIEWVRSLWARAGSARVTTNWGSGNGSDSDDGAAQSNALAELALLKRKFPASVWDAFESAARWDDLPEDMGSAAYAFAKHSTGFVSSMIAMWRGL